MERGGHSVADAKSPSVASLARSTSSPAGTSTRQPSAQESHIVDGRRRCCIGGCRGKGHGIGADDDFYRTVIHWDGWPDCAEAGADDAVSGLAGKPLRVAEQRRHDAASRALPNLCRRADLDDLPGHHHGDAVGEFERFFGIVGDDEGDAAGIPQRTPGIFPQASAQGGIDVGERFVEKHGSGLRSECPRQCNPLLLAAGEGVWVAILKAIKTHRRKLLFHHGAHILPSRGLAPGHQAKRDVLGYGAMREKHMVLEDEADGPTLGGLVHALPSHPPSVEQDLAGLQSLEPGREPQQGALAAAGWAEQAGDGTGLGCEIDIPQHSLRLVCVGDGAKLKAQGRPLAFF